MPDESSIYGTNTKGEAILRTSENAEGDPTSIYGVNSDGKACMRVSSDVTSDDPTSIYGVNGSGEACVRIEGSGGGGSPVIESLNVTPTTSAQTIRPDSGVDGFSPVNVSAVDSGIDANIVAENIKKDVTILGVKGSYEGGGGSLTQYGINIKGWCGDVDQITGELRTDQAVGTLDMSGVSLIGKSLQRKFIGSTGLVGAVDLGDVTRIEDSALESTFASTSITSADLSSVTYIGYSAMNFTFENVITLESVNLNALRSIDGAGLNSAFSGSGITTLTIPANDVSSDGPFSTMCNNCSDLRSVYFPNMLGSSIAGFADIPSGWMVQNVINQMFDGMIAGCSNCVVHFRSDFGTDIVQWCADNEEDPEFTTEADVAAYLLDVITHTVPGTNSVVFDIDPA